MSETIGIKCMSPDEAADAVALWKGQFAYFCGDSAVYPCWENNAEPIERYIVAKAEQGNAFIARTPGKLSGFITFDIFNFHGADSAICHFCGNAAELEDRKSIYLALYRKLSAYCADRGVLSHYISICANDLDVRDMLINLGFYGVDVFARFDQPLPFASPYTVGQAVSADAQTVHSLYLEAQNYFLRAPIHLKLPPCPTERIFELIERGNVFVAMDRGVIVGMMDVDIAPEDDIYRMRAKGCGVVCGELGAFIREDYRGRGIGRHLLSAISGYCVRNHALYAHVPWETFNPDANGFWPKFFTPAVLALKKTLHPDIL